jgi:hypothetical protein
MLSPATEFERRVVRGRQIVARQRELAAKLGEDLPIAVALLAAYERSLALLENAYERSTVLTNTVDKAVRGSRALLVANCPSPADTTGPGQDHQEGMRAVALIMEILREGGYHCELTKETMH